MKILLMLMLILITPTLARDEQLGDCLRKGTCKDLTLK